MRGVDRRTMMTGVGAAAAASLAAGAEGFVQVPGGRVWWRRTGSGRGAPLLLLHGGPGAGHDYLLPLKVLADERPVIFYDQLGCGRSDAPQEAGVYTIERAVQELIAVRKALGLERICLFGNSWGAMLAIEYMVTTGGPGVQKLVLSGALASTPQAVAGMNRLLDALPDGAGARIRALDAAGKGATAEYQELVQLFYDRHLCRRKPPPAEYIRTGENLAKSPAYKWMNGPNEFTITGVIKDWERRRDLRRIKVPTFITTGQYDEVTLDCHQTIQEEIRGSDLTIFGDCSHLTMLEKPAEYARAVREFIR